MQRESHLGRVLWSIVLILAAGYVVADFARSPFSAPPGSAAVRPAAVTIWDPAVEAGDEAGSILVQTAAGLELDGHRTVIKTLPGGSAAALISFLSRHHDRGALLAVSSTTLADLAHDRREYLVPGVSEEAALARALLRHTRPIGMLASTPLQVAVERRAAGPRTEEFLRSLTTEPWDQLFGIDDDTFSRDELASLVDGAGVDGEVHFKTYQSGSDAAQATEFGGTTAVLAGRPALLPEARRHRLRDLGWPLAEPAPHSWIGLVVPTGAPAAEVRRLRHWLRTLQREPHWRERLRAEGRRPAEPGVHHMGHLLRHTAPADALEQLTEEVEAN